MWLGNWETEIVAAYGYHRRASVPQEPSMV